MRSRLLVPLIALMLAVSTTSTFAQGFPNPLRGLFPAIEGPVAPVDPPPIPEKQIQVPLKTLIIVAHMEGDEARSELPAEYRQVADAFGFKNPTYDADGKTLRLGIPLKGWLPGSQVAKIEFKSDCPNNSQYGVQNVLAILEEPLKKACTRWCQYRHQKTQAPLQRIVISGAQPVRNFDVRLNIERVSALE